MPHLDQHPPGDFCWIELATSDQQDAKRFYQSLFHWTVNDFPMGPDEVYSMFQREGRNAAAAYTLRPEHRSAGIPPHWLPYIAVADADLSARQVAPLGGQVLAEPFDVFDAGRMAIIQDPTGAVFALWQSRKHPGIGIIGDNGSFCWADLITRDRERAGAFYSGLFGWKITLGENDPSGYLHIANGEQLIAGIPDPVHLPPETPPHWLLYFATGDCDASARRVEELGGRIVLPPTGIENVGRIAFVADPQGAVFALFQTQQPG